MIQKVKIENFKSIESLEIELGQFNVLIGANGSGKSNILEAVAMGMSAILGKVDEIYLQAVGVKISEPEFMYCAFTKTKSQENIILSVTDDKTEYIHKLRNTYEIGGIQWMLETEEVEAELIKVEKKLDGDKINENLLGLTSNLSIVVIVALVYWFLKKENNVSNSEIKSRFRELAKILIDQSKFIIFSPEEASLRQFDKIGQIKPLGRKGEGLFKLLKYLAKEKPEKIAQIKEYLEMIDWFEDFDIYAGVLGEQSLKIKDRYLDEELAYFDERSANEGFLYLLFYLTLFIADETPSFFAIENIEQSFNPRLCREIIKVLSKLAKENNKQVILTTHNPACLDGLNINDDQNRLFVIERNTEGRTVHNRIENKNSLNLNEPMKLSEAWMRGYLGGLAQHF